MSTQTIGFSWQMPESVKQVTPSMQDKTIARLYKLLPEFVWHTTYLENNPFTYVEVQTLLEGITIGGQKLSDEQQVLNQADSFKQLITLLKQQQFNLEKSTFCALHSLVAKQEALTWGEFRTDTVSIAGTTFKPPAAEQLNDLYQQGIASIEALAHPIEQALVFFLFAARNQFFFDGNKRTGRLMMNGILMSNNYDAITIPAKEKLSFNQKMLEFYDTQDGTDMLAFLVMQLLRDR